MLRIHRVEDEALLLCTRQDFTSEHIQNLQSLDGKAFDWNRFLNTALKNRIAPLVYTNLLSAGMELPPDIAVSFKKEYIENLLRKKEARNLLNQVLVCIYEWRTEYRIPIRTMLVKGAAFSTLIYKKPWYTRSGDIDLIFDLPSASLPNTARQKLINRLYVLTQSPNTFRPAIEYDFNIHHDLTLNGMLPINADRIWQEAEVIQLDGHDVWVMSPEDTLITAAVACCRRRYFFLKSLLDLSECTSHLENLNWKKVIEIAQSDQVNAILYTGLWLASECLVAQTPTWVFPELKLSSLQQNMIQRMVSYMMAHFSLDHLTRISDDNNHPLSSALLLTYLTFQPAQSIRKIIHNFESVLHG